MSVECSECEQDLRSGHNQTCSRHPSRKQKRTAGQVLSNLERPMLPIPIEVGKYIAEAYGYDQIIIIGRRVNDDPYPHGEHCTTYGVDEDHCQVAAACGDHLKHNVMGWPRGKK